jgi:hypothetical protein
MYVQVDLRLTARSSLGRTLRQSGDKVPERRTNDETIENACDQLNPLTAKGKWQAYTAAQSSSNSN